MLFFIAVSAMSALAQTRQSASPGISSTKRVPGVLYVKFKAKSGIDVSTLNTSATGNQAVDAAFALLQVRAIEPFDPMAYTMPIARRFGMDRIAIIYYNNTEITPDEAATIFKALPEVESLSPQFLFKPCYQTNDSLLSQQWAISAMNLPQAWDFSKGDTSVVIAICDIGINYLHEDLQKNLSTNPGEMGLDANGKDKRTNGKDDDGDGYKDNWRGWDFGGLGTPSKPKPDNDPVPGPGQSHGTFVTGCAAASTDNIRGVAGAGFNCRYLPLKVSTDSTAEIPFGYGAIHYASTHGARIINCSWGGYDVPDSTYIKFFQSFIDEATENNTLVVVAAGNDHLNIDDHAFYPASLKNVLTVGATDINNAVAVDFSNFGKRVDVFAPGANVLSIDFPGTNGYTSSGGTSFSSPYTAGVVGLLAAKHPDWKPSFLKRQIVETCDLLTAPTDRTKYWGRVSAFKAISQPATFPGLIITGYTIDGVSGDSLKYINKQYSLGVVFKNVVANGTALTAKLIKVDGYTVQQASSSLGAMNVAQSNTGSFKFTRDSSDDGKILPMKFYLTDGKTYKDSAELIIPIKSDEVFIDAGVRITTSASNSLRTAPNPATKKATAYFTLSEGGVIKFSISDMLGRTVRSFDAGTYDQGDNRFELLIDGLSSGVYVVKLESESGEQIVTRMIVQ